MGLGTGQRQPQGGHKKGFASIAVATTVILLTLFLFWPGGFVRTQAVPQIDEPSVTGSSAEQVLAPQFVSSPAATSAAASPAEASPAAISEPIYQETAESKVAAPVVSRTDEQKYSGILLAGNQPANVRFDSETQTPAFLTGPVKAPPAETPEQSAVAFFDANRDTYRMSDPGSELSVKRQESDALGMTHVDLVQNYKGIPVFAADLAVHFDGKGNISAVNGRYIPEIELSTEPSVTSDTALQSARGDLGFAADSSRFEPPELMILASAGGKKQLVWKITLAQDDPPLRMIYFVDAKSGEVTSRIDDLETARSRRTYTANNGSSLPGTLLINEGGSSSDTAAQAAHDNAGATYNYYFNTFGRDSFNNAGATINSTVNYSSGYNNAFWNGYQMVYGDGDGYVFGPLSMATDVVAHELTHAVTEYSADLVYSYQSGALNESYSDVFGAMVDRDDWLMGEDVYTPGTPGDALRSLSNPSQYGQPENMNSYVETSGDNGGVHTNSGIPNKAAYNIATAIGKDKMEKVWYRTLTVYLTSGAQFADARDASVQAAADLFGTASAEVTAVSNGFAAVGIGGTQQTDYSARVEIDHTYRGDLVVTLGVGDPNNPTWSTVVSNRSGGSADNVYSTVDISAAAAHIPPNWQNRWFLKVYDAAGYDEGFIRKFTITDHSTTYTAKDIPIEVLDYNTAVSYIPTFDGTPPSVLSTSPQDGATAYYSSEIKAEFSEDINPASLNTVTFKLKKHSDGSIVTADVAYDPANFTGSLHVAGGLAYSTAYDVVISKDVTDLYGNPLGTDYSWIFTTAPAPKNYFFTWYDQVSPGVKDWLVLGQPSTLPGTGVFDVGIAGQRMTPGYVSVDQGQTQALTFPGTMGGPVKVEALDGTAGIVSRRTLYGDSFEEINGLEESALTSRYYFAWYDTVSRGSQDWIVIANPNADPVEADVYISGNKMNSVPYSIGPGESVTPQFAGVIGGPVEVIAYEPGNELVPKNVMASERVLWNGNFNELVGIPANSLSNDYLFTWYDQATPGAKTWVLVSNPNSTETLAVEITVAGQKVGNSATGEQYYVVGPGESITPSFPGVLDGPMEVKGYNAATYNPANPGVSNMNFFTTQRSLFGNSFNEVAGFRTDRLRPQYFYSWYDQLSAGSYNWVLVSNPGQADVKAEIWLAGQKLKVINIAPGETQTPTFGGMMGGPLEIRGYDAATYDPNNPGAPNRNIFTSQRVLWKGHFNEVEGQTLQ